MNIIVIGGGPSGMMSAYSCAKNGHNVILLEKNEKVGKKLYITGKGRCNVTNNCNCEDFLNNVVTNKKFLYSSIYSFSPQDTIDFFNNYGVELKTERGNRVFPKSDKSSDIIKALNKACNDVGVKIILNENVIDLYKKDEKFVIKTKNSTYNSDAVVLCTGGNSYSSTGSDGYGYKLAKKFGHNIVEIKPALVPIKLKDDWIKSVEGLSLKNVKIIAKKNNKVINSQFGEMLFTSFGVSGPIILTISSYINRLDNIDLYIDFKPALNEETLDKRILREIESNKNIYISNLMKNLLPKKLIPIFLNKCQIPLNKISNSITQNERKCIIYNLKNFYLKFDRLMDIDYGIITSGGVNVRDVNPKTFESKLCKNLFFAGEILDVDALTGGFNIQIALSTGYNVGKGV